MNNGEQNRASQSPRPTMQSSRGFKREVSAELAKATAARGAKRPSIRQSAAM
jgi:hypothetical protein